MEANHLLRPLTASRLRALHRQSIFCESGRVSWLPRPHVPQIPAGMLAGADVSVFGALELDPFCPSLSLAVALYSDVGRS